MEWEAPAIVLDARPYGEGGALVTVLTEDHGTYRALARGGSARTQVALWQRGNLVQARWVARLADQLGSISAELVHPGAAAAMDDRLALATLSAAAAVAEGALPEREPHPRVFAGLVQLVAALGVERGLVAELVRWELSLLAELGYGLDLRCCAVTGGAERLRFVSPRSGRAVSAEGAGIWAERLLPLPAFLLEPVPAGGTTAAHWRDGLRLTAHFLARDAFGLQHRPLPEARLRLADQVGRLADTALTG